MLAFLRTIPAYVFGDFRDKQMLFCILQYPLEIIEILKANLSFSLFRLMGYRLAREPSGLTAEATETQDSISTPILAPNIQHNHNLLERAAVLSALISEYLL